MNGAFVLGDRIVEVRELPTPEPQHGEVLIRATAVGICGSDLHPYRQAHDPERKQLVTGHELAGVVERTGPGVQSVHEGDRVVAYQAWGCGRCVHCASGHANLCSNRRIIGKSHRYQKDYSVVSESMCLPLPEEMTFDDGVMLSCAGGTAWAALSLAKPCCDDALAVFGLGPVGLMAVMWARAMGAYVIGIETSRKRLALGSEMGAHEVINALEIDPVERIMELTGSGATVAFDAAGTEKAQVDVLRATHWAARVVYVAVGSHGPLIDPDHSRKVREPILGLRSISGSFTFALEDWYRMIRAVTLHGLRPGAAVTHRFALEQASQAYAAADAGECGKVVFTWRP